MGLAQSAARRRSDRWTPGVLLPIFLLLYAPVCQAQFREPVRSTGGMVASAEGHATRIGAAILKRGGTAVDAAIAVHFALAVTLPQAGNLGGGGFVLYHEARTGTVRALDYRETAPGKAHATMYLDAPGEPIQDASLLGHRACGPG